MFFIIIYFLIEFYTLKNIKKSYEEILFYFIFVLQKYYYEENDIDIKILRDSDCF